MDDLRNLVNRAHDRDDEAILNIIEIFKPYYKKLLQKSGYCAEESDFIVHIIHIINQLNSKKLQNFESNGQIFNYLKNGITNKYIQLLKQYFTVRTNEILFGEDVFIQLPNQEDKLYEDIYLEEILNHLTRLQKKIIIEKIMYGKADIEIADELHISRQSVNRIKNRALNKLKDFM